MTVDLILTLTALVLGVRLLLYGRRRVQASILVMAGGFLASAVALAASVAAHGWAASLGGRGLEMVFRAGALMVNLAAFCFAAGVVLASSAGLGRRVAVAFLSMQLLAVSLWTIVRSDEVVVIAGLATALTVASAFEIQSWREARAGAAARILAGVVAISMAVAARSLGLPLAMLLPDHRLPYQALILTALVLFYVGARRFHDRLPS